MDRLSFMKRLAKQHPDDAEVLYWLAKECAARGQWVEAIGHFSSGLAFCSDEQIRLALIGGITEATSSLQRGETAANTEVATDKNLTARGGENEDDVYEDQDDDDEYDEYDEYDDDEYDDDDRNNNTDQAASYDIDHADTHTDADGKSETSQASQPVLFSRSVIGLEVLDGGKSAQPVRATPSVHKVTFADVAGMKELKKTIQLRIISPFQNQGLFSKFRKKAGGGVLLYGPPGCGKTFITKATAGECRATFISVHITDILNKYIGVSEQNLKDLFDKARSQKPSVMFFDEIDTVGFNRSKSSSDMRGMIDTFLTEMEGIDTSTDQVLVIGATNMPWDVDSALKRPGRFDRLVFVGPPDEEAREEIFRLKLEGRYTDRIDTRLLASKTEFFSGADIENLCERAAESVLGEILETGVERPITMADFEVLLQEVRPSTLEWLRTAKNYVKYANQSGIYNDVEEYLRKYGRRI